MSGSQRLQISICYPPISNLLLTCQAENPATHSSSSSSMVKATHWSRADLGIESRLSGLPTGVLS